MAGSAVLEESPSMFLQLNAGLEPYGLGFRRGFKETLRDRLGRR
jgi:hypothetical protein